MTTALARRLAKVEGQLDLTQIAVKWLLEAQQYGSHQAYAESLHEHPDQNPLVVLPLQVAAMVRQTTKGQPAEAVGEQIEAAAEAILRRAFLVAVVNEHLAHERHVDEMELELLDIALDCLVHGCAEKGLLPRWIARLGTLTSNTQGWQSASAIIGRRYFAGHSPLHAEADQHLNGVARACTGLIDRYHAELGKGRGKRTRRINRAALLREGAAQAEGAVSWVVERAHQDVLVLTGQQAGTFRLSYLRRSPPEEPWG